MGWRGGGGMEDKNYKMLYIVHMNPNKSLHTFSLPPPLPKLEFIHSVGPFALGAFCHVLPHQPQFGYGMTLAKMFQKSSEGVMCFFTKVYILLLKGKAPNKEVFIIETKFLLNPTHSYHLFMLVNIYFCVCGFQYAYNIMSYLLDFETLSKVSKCPRVCFIRDS